MIPADHFWLVVIVSGCVGLTAACVVWIALETVANRLATRGTHGDPDHDPDDDTDGVAIDLANNDLRRTRGYPPSLVYPRHDEGPRLVYPHDDHPGGAA